MMPGLFHQPPDATPLAPEEREGLRQSWITRRRDLNEAEQENIVKGAAWARARRSRQPSALLAEAFIRALHRRMFGKVWTWAGNYRRTGRNIGIAAARIPVELPMMLDDIRYWLAQGTYAPDETAIRLHHRLVAIHPFPNGNGRHARLLADLLIESQRLPPFSWGSASLNAPGDPRARYIAALRAADNHNLAPLLAFARS